MSTRCPHEQTNKQSNNPRPQPTTNKRCTQSIAREQRDDEGQPQKKGNSSRCIGGVAMRWFWFGLFGGFVVHLSLQFSRVFCNRFPHTSRLHNGHGTCRKNNAFCVVHQTRQFSDNFMCRGSLRWHKGWLWRTCIQSKGCVCLCVSVCVCVCVCRGLIVHTRPSPQRLATNLCAHPSPTRASGPDHRGAALRKSRRPERQTTRQSGWCLT